MNRLHAHSRTTLAIALLFLLLSTFSLSAFGRVSSSQAAAPADQPRWHSMMVRSGIERDRNEIGGDGTQVPRAMEYSPKNNYQTIFFGVDTAGVYRSDDGGATWQSKTEGILVHFIRSLAVDPNNPDVVYALASADVGESQNPPIPSRNDGLYMTTDNGEHWQAAKKLPFTRAPEQAHAIAVAPNSFDPALGRSTKVFFGNSDGLYRSTDGAQTFTKISTEPTGIGDTYVTSIMIHPQDPNLIFVGTANGVYRSTDGGDTFLLYNQGLPSPIRPIRAIALDPTDVNRAYAITGVKAYRLVAAAWVPMNVSDPRFIPPVGQPDATNNDVLFFYYDIRVHPAAPNRLLLGAANWAARSPYYSEDYGVTWQLRENLVGDEGRFSKVSRYPGPDGRTAWPPVAFAPHPTDPNTWLCAFNFGAIYKTTDAAQSWSWSNTNYSGARGLRLILNPRDPNHFIINMLDLGPVVTFDGGQSFERALAVNHGKVDALGAAIDPDNTDSRTAIVYSGIGPTHLAILPGYLEKSVDGGRTFVDDPDPDTAGFQKAQVIYHPRDHNYIYAGDVYSTDHGANWTKVTQNSGQANVTQIVAVDPRDEKTVYGFDTKKIYRSTDSGNSWQPVANLLENDPQNLYGNFLNATAQHPEDTKFYIGAVGGIYIFDMLTNALTYRTYEHGFTKNPDDTINNVSVFVDPSNPSIVYAGDLNILGGVGAFVFKSTDSGMTWTPMPNDLASGVFGVKKIWGLGVDLRGILWAYTDNGPFWYGDLTAPDAPACITSSVSPTGTVTLTWQPSARAYTYQVKRSTTPGGPYTVVQGGVNGTSYTDTSAEPGTTYYYVVAGGNIAGEGPLSQEVASTGTSACGATATATPVTAVTPCGITFVDVPADNTFYPYVACLACRGIVGGYSDGTFRPNNDVTRGQLSKIVANSAAFNEQPSAQTFQDVPPTSPFYLFIERLAGRGQINGYPCGTRPGEPCVAPQNRPYFRPGANATRGQISKIVSNAAGLSTTPSGQRYEDVPPGAPFYPYIERLSALNVMGGYPCGGQGEPCGTGNKPYFRPNNNATRGQTSKIVANTFYPNCNPSTPAGATLRTGWGTAMQERGNTSTRETTYRLVARSTISGSAVRIRLSNAFGTAPVTFSSAYVGQRATAYNGRRAIGAGLIPGTNRKLTFNGQGSVTVPVGEAIYSDLVTFAVHAQQDLAVSLYVKDAVAVTKHNREFVTQYSTAADAGDHTTDEGDKAFIDRTARESMFWLGSIDVLSASATGAIVALGDSITDGTGHVNDEITQSTDRNDVYDRYPDVLARRLTRLTEPPYSVASVINEGIAGDTAAHIEARLERDVLSQTGITHVILLVGTNDLQGGATANDVIAGLKRIVDRVHARGLKIIGGTIMPRSPLTTPLINLYRHQINDFIRTSGIFDGVADFDAITRDPSDPERLYPPYDSGDGIHPSPAGYEAMGNGIDLSLLEP